MSRGRDRGRTAAAALTALGLLAVVTGGLVASARPATAAPHAAVTTGLATTAPTGIQTASAGLSHRPGDMTAGREVTRYDVRADVGADGRTRVTIDLDFDFGNDPGHGPYLTLPTRQRYDDSHDRLYQYSDITASSPTGAPAHVNKENDRDAIVLRIGDPKNGDVQGVQTYRIAYTVDGWVNPANSQHSGDELYWNVIGSGWVVPISHLSLVVTGPAQAVGAACYVGSYGSTDPCTSAAVQGSGGRFTQDVVDVGQQWSVVTGWPAGTFRAQPILGPRYDPTAALEPFSVAGGAALVVLVLGAVVVVRRVLRTGRDQAYLGLTPGLRPASGQQVATGLRGRQAVAVQFTPPEGTGPGAVGTLVDERANAVDVTATLVDLAVRGYLRIEEVPRRDPNKKPKDWTLVQLREAGPELLPFETALLGSVFAGRRQVRLSELRTTFAASMAAVQSSLYQHVTERGWFRSDPQAVRNRWRVSGGLLSAGGIIALVAPLTARVQVRGVSLIGVAILLVGLLTLVLARRAPARTADGTAVLAQALGFRQYLATAEANQIRFEEGQDVFSRYLPYAIVFGLADRWARVFAELAARGRAVPQPTWYTGYYNVGAGMFWAQSFAGAMDRFSTIATQSLSAPTPGSSGGSGFGGGGFSGGGVGGGGGGGW
ncbi:DUF2207 domain-containing protein [Cellulomonas sp. SG140]|uniref:DUF2207 domain-containing protein n=1 Tax=Cellulomonas sp. SG140 TaxID=2976536 RepID=UPI0021E83B43|nr:DUF2207 domain-containing protein [Cellulomonas sp. SG140]